MARARCDKKEPEHDEKVKKQEVPSEHVLLQSLDLGIELHDSTAWRIQAEQPDFVVPASSNQALYFLLSLACHEKSAAEGTNQNTLPTPKRSVLLADSWGLLAELRMECLRLAPKIPKKKRRPRNGSPPRNCGIELSSVEVNVYAYVGVIA